MFIPVRKLLQLKYACYIRADVSKYLFYAHIPVPSIQQYLCTKTNFQVIFETKCMKNVPRFVIVITKAHNIEIGHIV